MAKESFMMISLEEDKAKNLAQVLSNNKCRMIIDYMTGHDSVTESEISDALDIPLSTVHYNIQQLLKNNLVESVEYHYSKKGKEVQHYSLANKYIIISPKPVYGIKQKLRSILPALLVISAAAVTIKLLGSRFLHIGAANSIAQPEMMKTTFDVAKGRAEEVVLETAPVAAQRAVDGATQVIHTIPPDINMIVIWFIAGALFALGTYFLVDWIRRKSK